ALEQSLLSFFPEAIGLRVLPVGELGTATFTSADQGLRSHIQVDMVRRSSEGKQVAPESYEVEGQWYTSFVSLVKHPQIDDRRAVILLTLDNDYLSSQLSALNTDLGAFALEQLHISKTGREQARTIATSGSSNSDDVWYAELPNADWRVAFSPSRALEDELGINGLPLLAVLAMTLLAAIGSVGLFVRRFPRTLEREAEKIIAAADRRSPLELKVPELIEVAKQLRRVTLRTLRQAEGEPKAAASDAAPAATPAQDEVLANPLYHAQGGMLVEEHDADSLDLDLALNEEAAPAGGKLPDHIFRAYDIRGHAKQELTDDLVTRIGKAIGTIAGERGEQTLIIGCDGRTSSPRIKAALVRALMETGRDIVDIGLVPTPLLYYATRHLEYHSGIMVTGSHNPPDDNGLKIVLDQQTIAAGGIQEIKQRAAAGNFADGNGRMVREDIVADYIHEILEDIAIAVPLKVVIDAGNGATGEVAPELFRELGCEVVPLHCKIDGTFPNHPPDTSNENNLADLARAVKESSADFGVAFDGDGDRLAVVTSSGRIVRTDVLLMLYAQDVVSRNPGADVVFDVKCSRNLTNLITHHGGRPVLWKTGHAFMKEKMRETGALLGGEFSGHIFFGERWYGFDDGMYAAARLAEIMSTQGDSLDDAIDKFPTTVNTPEILIPVPDDYKFQLIDKIVNNADFSSGKVNTLDGIRVDFSDGWGLVRASNTGPALTARFEADTPEHLEIIQDEFRAQIALIDPKVELNF
ncbi:MAG: phosphomannomutase/phosphoglucomutase, partial [Halioglobus sp.]|nr:phosphomannomutase/phosphoglucomutase [Halioglobus sp.]